MKNIQNVPKFSSTRAHQTHFKCARLPITMCPGRGHAAYIQNVLSRVFPMCPTATSGRHFKCFFDVPAAQSGRVNTDHIQNVLVGYIVSKFKM